DVNEIIPRRVRVRKRLELLAGYGRHSGYPAGPRAQAAAARRAGATGLGARGGDAIIRSPDRATVAAGRQAATAAFCLFWASRHRPQRLHGPCREENPTCD